MATNVFVVRTPLQLFNAIEARDRFHAGETNCLLLCFGSPADRALLEAMVDDGWAEVRRFRFHGLGKYLYGWVFAGWLARLKPVANVYVGLIRHLPLHVVNVLAPARPCLLDDGNETLHIARVLQGWRANPVRHLEPRLLDRLLRLKLSWRALDRLEAFSLYDTTPFGIPCQANDYRVFRRRTAALPERACVVFIGSNLVGTYFRDEAAFLARLARVRDGLGGQPLLYCPHRYESAALRRKIAALGFELFEPGTILEYAFLRAGWRPALLASFRSTAVDTLGLIYGIPGCLLEIPAGDAVNAERWQEMQAVWEDFRSRGGRLVRADDY